MCKVMDQVLKALNLGILRALLQMYLHRIMPLPDLKPVLEEQAGFHLDFFEDERGIYFVDHGETAEFGLQEGFVFAAVPEADLQDKVEFAGEVQAGLHFGFGFDGFRKIEEGFGGMAVQLDEGDHQGGTAEEVAVEQRDKAFDVAFFAQFAEALADGGFAFINGQPDVGRVQAGIFLEDVEDADVGGVELAVLWYSTRLKIIKEALN